MIGGTLHIYAQPRWHDEAGIVGDIEALTLLRNAIDEAIKTGTGAAESFTSDGGGYEILVIATSDMGELSMPYTDPIGTSGGNSFLALPQAMECYAKIATANKEGVK